MLKVMRDSFHHLKWVLLAVVAAFIFGFVFIDMGMGGSSFGGGGGDEQKAFAARVNGETITYNDFYRSVKNLEDMYRQMYGQQFTPEMAAAMGLPQQVLDSLIDQRLLTQEAGRLHLAATPEEVRKRLLEIPTFTQDGKFVGMELYTRYVTGPLGYSSAAAFEDDLARDLTLQKMESALMSSLVVSPKTAEAEYRRMNESATIRYVLLPATVQAAATVTPAEVEDYYRKNQAKYSHGEQRKIRYLLADLVKLRASVTPTEQDLRQAYESRKEEFKKPGAARVLHILVKVDPAAPPAADAAARAKAQGIVQQLRAGGDFAALAAQHSEDPSSSGNGGDMGFVEMGQTVEPFERAIFSIPLNSISDPIRSQEYGYHIVKVTERREESVQPFEAVRTELASSVAADRAQNIARTEIDRVGAIVKQNKPANVQAFSGYATDKITSNDSGYFGRNDMVAGIGSNPNLTQWAFQAKKGDVSQPIGTSRGPIVAFVEDIRPAGTSPLSEVREQVEADAREEKGREAARAALAASMAGAPSLDAVAQKSGQQVREATVSRQGNIPGLPGDAGPLVDAAMKASVGAVQGPVMMAGGAVAFEVVSQKKVTPEEFEKNRVTYIDNIRTQQARTLRTVLLQRLRKDAKIEVNDEITRPTTSPAGV